MIEAADYAGTIPYGQECNPERLSVLPEGTYITCLFANGDTQVMRLLSLLTPNGGRYAECDGEKIWSIFLKSKITALVPLREKDAFVAYPLGTKVQVYAKEPYASSITLCSGLIVEHLKQRVKVRLLFADGSVVERPYYPTQLRKA